MSLSLDFEPHSLYMGFAIKDDRKYGKWELHWSAYIDNGNTYGVDELEEPTLERLKQQIRAYHLNKHTGYGERIAKKRLEYLRGELQAERISYGELAELQGLTPYIEDGDVELLEAAGVPEGEDAQQQKFAAIAACLHNFKVGQCANCYVLEDEVEKDDATFNVPEFEEGE